jgi:hypothetical protein
MSLRNIVNHLQDHTVLQPGRPQPKLHRRENLLDLNSNHAWSEVQIKVFCITLFYSGSRCSLLSPYILLGTLCFPLGEVTNLIPYKTTDKIMDIRILILRLLKSRLINWYDGE